MDENNIVAAPQIADMGKYYEIWRKDNAGSFRTFVRFMTTPSPERDSFFDSFAPKVEFIDRIVTTTIA